MGRRIFFFLSAIFLMSCTNNTESAMGKIEEQFKLSLKALTNSQNINSDIYMVIPRAGCSACISTAEKYMMDKLKNPIKNPSVKFILTDFDSQKMLRARFGNLFKSEQLIIDPENIFKSNKSLKSLYPTIYFFDKSSRLIQVSEVSPGKDGIADIAIYSNNKLVLK
ncbi:MAG: hypothetical protein Q8S11_02055 [Daejeonella sp.]|uniref:hypothetical protein n=1 Tax=Daejeonella sp. TaxID=2805397 RepID=UPI00273706C4|nr:hypothetical protein [Daejeonella sp.]MDP3467087.1 hypothetical protein [Daejeonella sp.]